MGSIPFELEIMERIQVADVLPHVFFVRVVVHWKQSGSFRLQIEKLVKSQLKTVVQHSGK